MTFTGFPKEALDFYDDLELDNTKSFWAAHKDVYETCVKAPMLVLQGERDFQVTRDDFARWKSALGSRADVTLRSYPALNHLFIAGSGPASPAEYEIPGHVAEEVVTDIANWVQTARRG